MNEMIHRIRAIARADVLFRFRRTTAIITLLVIAGGMYLIVPDIQSGRTLIQVEGSRVIYNSAAVALGTGLFCALLISLFGYYLISNSIKRDIVSRMGYIIAATPVTNSGYVIGKFIGNIVYLSIIVVVCMLSAMVMFLIRGESSLEPLVFLGTYAWLVLPSIVFCSAVAITFESLPALSGRAGDVLYFFIWAALLSIPAIQQENNVRSMWLQAFDFIGMIQVIQQMQDNFQTASMSIGATDFDAAKSPILFTGLRWSGSMIAIRAAACFVPALILILGWAWFHRFNPARIKSSVRHAKNSLLARLNSMVKPLTKMLEPLARIGDAEHHRASIVTAIRADVLATLALSPFTVLAIVIFGCISLLVDAVGLREGVVPAIIVVLVLALSDIATRDYTAGTMSLLFTAPNIKKQYVLWKWSSAFVLTLCFTLIPIVRLLVNAPVAAISLFIGSCFITSGAIGLGILAKNRKPYIGVFLMLLYITLNAADAPALDFAGIHAKATPLIQFSYAIISAFVIGAAYVRHKVTIR